MRLEPTHRLFAARWLVCRLAPHTVSTGEDLLKNSEESVIWNCFCPGGNGFLRGQLQVSGNTQKAAWTYSYVSCCAYVSGIYMLYGCCRRFAGGFTFWFGSVRYSHSASFFAGLRHTPTGRNTLGTRTPSFCRKPFASASFLLRFCFIC
jgi:hypothetical protein